MIRSKIGTIITIIITISIFFSVEAVGSTKSNKELENEIDRLENKLSTQKSFYNTSLFIYSTVFSTVVAILGIAAGFVSQKYFVNRLRQFDKKVENKHKELADNLNEGFTKVIAYHSTPYDVITGYLVENENYHSAILAGLQICTLSNLGMRTANDEESFYMLRSRFSHYQNQVRNFIEHNLNSIIQEDKENKFELLKIINRNIQTIESEIINNSERHCIAAIRFYYDEYLAENKEESG